MLFESLSHVINQESHVYSWNLGEIYLVHFWNFELGKFIPKHPCLNMWLLAQIEAYNGSDFKISKNVSWNKKKSISIVEATTEMFNGESRQKNRKNIVCPPCIYDLQKRNFWLKRMTRDIDFIKYIIIYPSMFKTSVFLLNFSFS